jgi:nucleotide-binding universal stress UspA family protein
MTTHGRGGLQRLWLGSVADRLVRSLDIPMLLIGPSEATGSRSEPAVRQILVPLDGSRRAEAVLPAALALARLFGATITLLQAVYPVALACDPPTSFPPELDQKLTVIQRREAQDYLDGLAERMTEAGVPTTAAAVVGGSAFEVIQAAAQSPGTGIVAIASGGRGGVSRLMLGSVADKLVRAGDYPILFTKGPNK